MSQVAACRALATCSVSKDFCVSWLALAQRLFAVRTTGVPAGSCDIPDTWLEEEPGVGAWEAQSWAQSKYPWTRRLNARRLRIAAACERDQSIRGGVITRAGVYMDFKTKSAGT
jgi:hypothetical protein